MAGEVNSYIGTGKNEIEASRRPIQDLATSSGWKGVLSIAVGQRKVEPGECSPFWPKTVKNSAQELVVRMSGTTESSIPFSYMNTLSTLLKLPNKYGGVSLDIQMTEGAVYITINKYEPGMAPALLVNHTDYEIPLMEKDVEGSSFTLKPSMKKMFTWSNIKDNRSLIWCQKYSNELRKDEIGDFNASPSVKLYFVSFLDGMQRVLLFTPDLDIARDAQVAGDLEIFDQEIVLQVHGVGLSLVDNFSRTEVLYLGITSSGIIWESRKSANKKFKAMSAYDNNALEEAYKRYQQELIVGRAQSKVAVHSNLEVDFSTNEILRPQHRQLRRTYNQGLWLQTKTSKHQYQLHAKVNRLQMDNQMYDCVFPVVLAPVPPPKSVNMENALKPFAEVSIVQRLNERSTVQQYKYFKVLIQEFHIKVDIGFINALVKFFEAGAISDEQEAKLFAKDRMLVDQPLMAHVSLVSSQEQKNFYDFLHFSPLKIHVSFSLSGGGPQAQTQSIPPILNVLMQSLGVTLTDIHDVVLKLSYFERTTTFLNQRQLISEAQMHYVGQLVKQLYVLVLGLDVLGNPFGLVVGLTQGVEDLFYEPFQGAIQGPGEFAEGLVLGMRSLFGHTVGGAAGAFSRITGAMGKGLAALTFDEDYQRKRREALNQRPNTVQEGIARSGKGLVMGVVEGVGGVFTKPISGAKEEGVEGFFKGVGKGMMGLVTRPTAGVVDFASGSFNAVKRATELGEEVTRLRHPRYFKSDNLVRPYCKLEAEGNKLLKELEKGKYYATDVYVYHYYLGLPKSKDILLLTDKRLAVLSHNDIFGGNQVEFAYTWGELSDVPLANSKGILIKTGEGKRKLGFFKSSDQTKLLLISDESQKQWIVDKIKLLMNEAGSGTSSRSNTLS